MPEGRDDAITKTKLAEMGGRLIAGSAADFGKHIADETEKWAMVVKSAGIKAD